MYLKSIEIQGFKSFPDKTLLTFSQGVTAVVGPNGSGKSNIADAIRWVLGEQSARTLRGGKMEDVIFGGTKRRSPMGFCEVALTVDNSDGSIPLEYNEITVTRRYYRSGESDFFINRRPVRLKDIREMFMDTGLGQDGYSMIGQGRIDEILSVKSAERREIFEEAAGISKVRLRKEESHRRLERAEENLVRIRDIITELEDRVGPLKAQAEKAKKFLLLRDELRVLEVSAALDSLEKLDGQIKTARADFENAERMLSARKRELQELYDKNEAFAEEVRNADLALEQGREKLEELRAAASRQESLLAVAEANLKNAGDNRRMRREEAETQRRRIAELEGRMDEREERLKEIEELMERGRTRLESIAEEIAEASRLARDATERLEAMRASHAVVKDKKQAKDAEVMSLEAALREMEDRRAGNDFKLSDDKDRLERQLAALAELDEKLDEAREERASAQNAIDGFDMMMGVRQSRVDKARAGLTSAEREINAKTDRLSMLRNMERDMEGFSHAVRRVAQAGSGLTGIHGPLSSLIRAEDRYSVAIETALGGAMQNIVVDSEESAKAAIGYLKANNFGRATFLPVTSIKPRYGRRQELKGEPGFCGYGSELISCDPLYSDIVASFLGNTAVVDNIDNAIAMGRKYKYAFRIVTLDGQLISSGGAMTGGSLNKNVGVLTRANEVRYLEEELKSLKASMDEKREAAEKAERELAAASYQRRTAEDQIKAADEVIAELNARRSRDEAIAESLRDAMDAIAQENASFDERRSKIAEQIKALRAEASELENEAAVIAASADELARETGGDGTTGELEQRLTDARVELGALESERASAEEQKQMIADLLDTAKAELVQKLSEAEKATDEISQLNANIDACRAETERLSAERDKLEADIAELTKKRLSLDGDKSRLDKEIQAKNDDILTHERSRMLMDNKREQLENESSAILDRLWEAYELTPVTAKEIYKEPEDKQAAQKRINELKASIRSLGSVNLDAVEEYEQVNERYTFMSGQRDDLEKAKADLSQVIDRLTKNMEDAFADRFRRINESFSTTFTEIFGGGSAFLKLEDEKNILECGIDISVELPGKGHRAISLLSGGEKAFVATALYFAIIKVSPTPFCVMDEIDAPLDEVNVTRFAEYMRRLCETTQFIVITHRRGTMEGSDILYGATMQEHGVTKLLKLDIREAESKLNIKLS